MIGVEDLIETNRQRYAELTSTYQPVTGKGSIGIRQKVHISDIMDKDMYLPSTMLAVPLVKKIIKAKSIHQYIESDPYLSQQVGNNIEKLVEKVRRQFIRIRCKHDFQFFAFVYGRIKNKEGGKNIPFRLNHAQVIVLKAYEAMRLNNVPIRAIIEKARQWGGSTLTQIYIAWIQLFWVEGWYSAVIAQDSSTSRKIKAMYSKLLESLPSWLIGAPDGEKLAFTPYEGSQLDSIITYGKGSNAKIARDTVINVGTYNNPNAGRGGDVACVHYSEVAYWLTTDGKTPEDVVKNITSSLLLKPLTVEVLESTANGMGNFFYFAYKDAKEGKSNRKAIFIAWFQIERYMEQFKSEQQKIEFARWLLSVKDDEKPDPEHYWDGALDEGKYYYRLWLLGATLEGILWYIHKRKDYRDHTDMMSEFPSDDVEAFKNSGNNIFSTYMLDELRKGVRQPSFVGDIGSRTAMTTGKACLNDLHFIPDVNGDFRVWEQPVVLPDKISNRYLVIVDVGGRGRKADYSVILVIDRYWMMYAGKPTIVAEWHGHIDHDLLAWKAAQIATWYNNALLVIESNTLETKDNDTDGDQSEYILNLIGDCYGNLYARPQNEEDIKVVAPKKWGFQTNKRTKPVIISNMVAVVREQSYIERSEQAISEMAIYEKKEGGGWGNADGPDNHDDRVMVRAIGLYICFCVMPLPAVVKQVQKNTKAKRPNNEATIL